MGNSGKTRTPAIRRDGAEIEAPEPGFAAQKTFGIKELTKWGGGESVRLIIENYNFFLKYG